MLSHRHWTTFILLLFFTIACQGYNYGNDTTVEIFDARDLEARWDAGGDVHKLRIVAVGDVHGDYERFLTILKYLGVVDQYGRWSGKVDVFVQLGDVMDRGPDTLKLFGYLDELRGEADKHGGKVYTLLGNHEVENLMHRWGFVNPEELKTFGPTDHENVRRRALTKYGSIGKSLANNYLGALLLPLYQNKPPYELGKEPQFSHSAIAFVHAGLSPSTYEKLLPFPGRINSIAKGLVERLQEFLLTNVKNLRFSMSSHVVLVLSRELTPDQELLCDQKQGPLWYRGLAARSPDCPEVERMLKVIGARRIVVGHTRNEKGIVENCNGKIIVIDTGKIHLYRSALVGLSDIESRNYELGAFQHRFSESKSIQVCKREGWDVICVRYPIHFRWQDAEGSGTCRVSGPGEAARPQATGRYTVLK
ncbi:Metallo-dependent phosphatase [Amanita rubescens]|nr:Metallo-dependent phosphatase [Amanita rubescens]KAF8349170.1 Metallo-dependent phosphatase [Amanita rubescens]